MPRIAAGGNIAVLTAADGKLLVDAGITASRPRIVDALTCLGDLWWGAFRPQPDEKDQM